MQQRPQETQHTKSLSILLSDLGREVTLCTRVWGNIEVKAATTLICIQGCVYVLAWH